MPRCELVLQMQPARSPTPETQSAPAPELLSAAARRLATLPRRPLRRWTGFIGVRRVWRDQEILLPSGERAFVFGCLRQRVVYTFDRGRLEGTFTALPRWGVISAEQVRVVKIPEAVLLGKRKSGVHETRSLRKAEAARRNAGMPPRPGQRARGRPRKLLNCLQ